MKTEQKVEMPDPTVLLDKIIAIADRYPSRVSTGFYTVDGRAECIVGVALNEGLEWPVEKIELMGTTTIGGLYGNVYHPKGGPLDKDQQIAIDTITCIQELQDNGTNWKQAVLEGIDYFQWLLTNPYGD